MSGLDAKLAVWSRQRWLASIALLAPLIATVTFAMALPDLYQSSATVLVEHLHVSETFVKSSVISELETRLQSIKQEVLSRSRLLELIFRFDLYPELRKRNSLEEVTDRMRRDIRMELKSVESVNAIVGRGPTVAFTLTYRGRDPQTVKEVTSTLASLFVAVNLKDRQRQATGTAEFLRVQLEETKKKLDEEEGKVDAFKRRHAQELPEQLQLNINTLERLNMEFRLNQQAQMLVKERLEREKLMRQSAMASTDAPGRDLADALAGPIAIAARIALLNQELTELRTRFSEKYPEVIRAKAEIAALERQLAGTRNDEMSEAKPDSTANPVPHRLKKGRGYSEAELSVLKEQENTLQQAIATYQRRVDNAPRREQEFRELSRDYNTMKELYNALFQRYQEALVAVSMEQGQKRDQFRILDPANLPTRPSAPNRLLLLLIGLILSAVLASCVVSLAEHHDTSFHTVEELRTFTKVPVLVSVPQIVTKTDISWRRRQFGIGTVTALLGLTILVGASYYVAHDNTQLVWMMGWSRS
jgi:polysaccharide chain length determinant protein (PEP-CTERM system associated)